MSRRLSKLLVAAACVLTLSACQSATGPSLSDLDADAPTPQLDDCLASHANSGTC